MLRSAPIAILFLCMAMPVQAEFISPAQVDLLALMPPPPAEGSVQARIDLEKALLTQATSTPEIQANARADVEETVFRFGGGLFGDKFTKENLPKTAAFFPKVLADGNAVVDHAKDVWGRARPCQAHADKITALLPCPKSASHPSGHATFAYEMAVLLSNIVPEKRAEVFKRADDYAQSRVIVGAHYPSDIEAGHLVGTVTAYAMMQNPAFQQEFAAVKAEIRGTLGYADLQ